MVDRIRGDKKKIERRAFRMMTRKQRKKHLEKKLRKRKDPINPLILFFLIVLFNLPAAVAQTATNHASFVCGTVSGQLSDLSNTIDAAGDRRMTWRFSHYGVNPSISQADLKTGVRQAFQMFEKYWAVDFVELSGARTANIYVVLHAGHLYLPGGGNALMQWDSTGHWHYRIPNALYISGARNLVSIPQVRVGTAHEIGHVFGAVHTAAPSDIMNIAVRSTLTNFTKSDWNQISRALRPRALRPWNDKPNLPPVLVNDKATMQADDALTIQPLLNDRDPEGQPLKLLSAWTDFKSEDLRVDNTKLYFKPRQANHGTANIVYRATDGKNEGVGTVVVTITPRNYSWQNPTDEYDVNNNGIVSSLDALLILNAMDRGTKVKWWFKPSANRYYDVNDDRKITAMDALLITNELRRRNIGLARYLDAAEVSRSSERVLEGHDTIQDSRRGPWFRKN